MNPIETLQKEMEATRVRVRQITGMSDNDILDLQLDAAHEWLVAITRNNTEAVENMKRLREFWGFWKKTWHKADLAFIDYVERWEVQDAVENLYRHYHRVTLDNAHINNPNITAEYHLVSKLSGRRS